MSEMMSMEEIKRKYDSEWVLIEDPQTTEALDVIGGKVLFHSKDREAVHKKTMELQPQHSAVLFVGKPEWRGEYVL